jgi:hypothetical protein
VGPREPLGLCEVEQGADRGGRMGEGGIVGVDHDPRHHRRQPVSGKLAGDSLLEPIARGMLSLAVEHLERMERHAGAEAVVQRPQSDIRPRAARQHDVVLDRQGSQGPGRIVDDRLPLWWCGGPGLRPHDVPTQRHDNQHQRTLPWLDAFPSSSAMGSEPA